MPESFEQSALRLLEAIAAGGGGGGGGGGGDATAENQLTGIDKLESLRTALADPPTKDNQLGQLVELTNLVNISSQQSTASRQDLALAELEALANALTDPATQTKQNGIITRLESLLIETANQATKAKQDLALVELQKLTAQTGLAARSGAVINASSPALLIFAPGTGKYIQLLSLSVYPSLPRELTFSVVGKFINMAAIEMDFSDRPIPLPVDTALTMSYAPTTPFQFHYHVEYRVLNV